ncbi:hypothetical protein LBMAG49_17560 [Planctomycetota bacterium]|nr:hypothetical protein LBMAG49_17560 [Planctomycetota bacterium]
MDPVGKPGAAIKQRQRLMHPQEDFLAEVFRNGSITGQNSGDHTKDPALKGMNEFGKRFEVTELCALHQFCCWIRGDMVARSI